MRRLLTNLVVWIAAGYGCLLSVATAGDTESHLIAIGQVDGVTGNLVSGANSIGATSFTCSRVGAEVGRYEIVIDKPGIILDRFRNHFLVQVTPKGLVQNAIVARAVASGTGSRLYINVTTCNAEEIAVSNDNDPQPEDASFYFAVYLISNRESTPANTKFLVATGKVAANGSSVSGAAVDGIMIETERARRVTGDYLVNLRKTGAFAGATADDFVLLLSVEGGDTGDVVAKGEVETITDDLVSIRVRTDDAQGPSLSITTPEDEDFFFTVYRIPSGPDFGPPTGKSRLLVAMGRITNGFAAVESAAVFPGGALVSQKDGVGDYRITIDSPGAFTGAASGQYVLQLCADDSRLSPGDPTDIGLNGVISIPTGDQMIVDVAANDLEKAGQSEGAPSDTGFYFFVYDTVKVSQPDLRIGKKGDPARHRGNNRYGGPAGQALRLKLPGTRTARFHFSLENDGNLGDDLVASAQRSGSRIKARYFRLTGGRQNITAALLAGMVTETDVAPGELLLYQSKIKYRRPDRRGRKRVQLAASPGGLPPVDTNRLILIPR